MPRALGKTLARFFSTTAPLAPGQVLLVAFSGGPDSTVLLCSLGEVARRRGFRLAAAHVDHGLDAGSQLRARYAEDLCRRLGVSFHLESAGPPAATGESLEEAARRIRYERLESVRRRLGARWVATAHHRDDQVETVLLRIAFGGALAGLEGIQVRRGRVVRPLLGMTKAELSAELERWGLAGADDPTNRDLRRPRNRLRHAVIPRLAEAEPDLMGRLAAVAVAAGGARRVLERRLEDLLRPRPVEDGWAVPAGALASLPQGLADAGLDFLHRLGGSPYPPTAGARTELRRQLAQGGGLGCDCGGGWRWERRRALLALVRHATSMPLFSYTFSVPGALWIEELGLSFRLCTEPRSALGAGSRPSPADVSGGVFRALLGLPLRAGEAVEVRNRRPGDRVRLRGSRSEQRLKDVFIGRGVPRGQRDRLPLLCRDGEILWVPGITLGSRIRSRRPATAWIAEITPHEQPPFIP